MADTDVTPTYEKQVCLFPTHSKMHLQCWETQLHEGVPQQAATLLWVNSARQGAAWRAGVLHACQQEPPQIVWEPVCMRQPTCLLYLPAGLHCKKHLQKKPGHFRVLMTVCGTSSLLKPVFLSAATLGLLACKILPLISLYTCSACLFPFFFFFFSHHWKIWSRGCVTSRYTHRRSTRWKLRCLLLSLILCLLT